MTKVAELQINAVTYGGNTLRTPITLTVTKTLADENPSLIRIQEGFAVVEFKNQPKKLIPLTSVIDFDVAAPGAAP